MEKSRDAFRTISEVAEWLDVPTHVLRFWESRFSQIKPVKRAGGRRYYRPSDMRVIGGVKVLLHDQGMTIRGVQKLFREKGIRHVSSFSPELFDGSEADIIETTATDVTIEGPEELPFIPARPTPSAAASDTRDATRIPQEEDEGDGEEAQAGLKDVVHEAPAETQDDVEREAPPDDDADIEDADAQSSLFSSSRQPAEAPQPAEETPEPEPARASIPDTPDVPETDPDDDSGDHARPPSIAARLASARTRDLRAHREALASARDRLAALRERIG